jgi:hypothetical protein
LYYRRSLEGDSFGSGNAEEPSDASSLFVESKEKWFLINLKG